MIAMPESTDSEPGADEDRGAAPHQDAPSLAGPVAGTRSSPSNATAPARRPRGGAASTADQVGTIVAAAELAAEQIRLRTEARMRDRIAEGDRAAENRIRAAESEAFDIVKSALQEAERAKSVAASEALGILAKAHDDADRTRQEAEEVKAASTSEALAILAKANEEAEADTVKAKAQSREILGEARVAAADVLSEGTELVQNLREMGDSLRANASLLLQDIQQIHARMVAELDRVDGGASRIPIPRAAEREPAARRRSPIDSDELEVPEFIPPG
jgi:hypothetical protein